MLISAFTHCPMVLSSSGIRLIGVVIRQYYPLQSAVSRQIDMIWVTCSASRCVLEGITRMLAFAVAPPELRDALNVTAR